MAIDKKRKNDLIKWANESILENHDVYKGGEIVSESYNGQIAAFSVSVALSGLKPAMALYYSETEKSNIDKKNIIELLASMYSKDMLKKEIIKGKQLFDKVIDATDKEEPELRRKLIEYAIALKLAIRTFKFRKS